MNIQASLPRILLCATLLMVGCRQMPASTSDPTFGGPATRVLWLQSGATIVGISPELGGRIVYLGREGGSNLLWILERYWQSPPTERLKPAVDGPNFALGGGVVWLAPQSAWWSRQDLDPKKRDRAATWPPDPFQAFADFRIEQQSEQAVVLQGPPSPISGIAFRKTAEVLPDGFIRYTVTATNHSDEPVEWGLWMNFFLRATALPTVPLPTPDTHITFRSEIGQEASLEFQRNDWLFRFLDWNRPGETATGRWTKAFIHGPVERVDVRAPDAHLVFELPSVDSGLVHPEHAFVEIFASAAGKPNRYEVETHGPYRRLSPGESTSLDLRFTVHSPESATEPLGD